MPLAGDTLLPAKQKVMPLLGPRLHLSVLAVTLSLVMEPAHAAAQQTVGTLRWSATTATAARPDVPAVAFSTDGMIAFAGESGHPYYYSDGNLVARAAGTGSRLWTAPRAVTGRPIRVVAAGADAVVVASQTSIVGSQARAVLAAFRPTDGSLSWRHDLANPAGVETYAVDLVADPGRGAVYRAVTEVTYGPGGATHGRGIVSRHDLETGAQLWSRSPLGTSRFTTTALGTSMDGQTLFVGGTAYDGADLSGAHRWLGALDTGTGSVLWVKEDRGLHGTQDGVDAIAVTPDGSSIAAASRAAIFVGGSFQEGITVSVHAASTGARVWRSERASFAWINRAPLKLTPDGRTVLVGTVFTSQNQPAELSVIAYDVSSGTERWAAVFPDGVRYENDVPLEIHVDPAGGRAYVVGRGPAPGVFAFSTGSGAALHDTPWTGDLSNESSALSPDGETLLVAGASGVNRAVSAIRARGAPTAPASFSAGPGPGQGEVTLSWALPRDDGGSPLTGFRVYRRGSTGQELVAEVEPSTRSHRLTGLPFGQMERYSVTAVSAFGEGARSTDACATPYPWVASLDGLRCI